MNRILIIFVTIIIALITTNISAQTPEIDSLLIKSVGGEEAFNHFDKVNSISTYGKATLNNVLGTFRQFIIIPDRVYLEVQFPGFGMTQVYDRGEGWQLNLNGSYQALEGLEKKEIEKNLYLETYSYLFDNRLPGDRFLQTDTIINGHPAVLIGLTPFNRDTLYIILDKQTGLRINSIVPLDFVNSINTYDNYKSVEGVLIPFEMTSEILEANFKSGFQIDSIFFNRSIDSTIFTYTQSDQTDYHFPDSLDEISFPFNYHMGHIRVIINVNGRKKVWMILDSGASSNIFHQPAFDSMNLEIIGQLPAVGIGGIENVNLVKSDSIQIDGLTLYRQVGGLMNLGSLNRFHENNIEFGGLLGYDFLSRFPIKIDYKNEQLTVYNPDTFSLPDGGEVIPFYTSMSVPTIKAQVEGIEGDFIVDLGNAFGLILHENFLLQTELKNSLQFSDSVTKFGGISGVISNKVSQANSFKIGSLELGPVNIKLPVKSSGLSGSADISGNIGNQILQNKIVLLDYKNSRLILYKSK